ncbi:MAG: cytochrome-c peroxidase, partial [Sphingobacteriaceae bacterium]|nr:cytochrome-c peroxidase [Sphingobacteriaceae bacterium]
MSVSSFVEKRVAILIFSSIIGVFFSCKKEKNTPIDKISLRNVVLEVPSNLPKLEDDTDNPLTKEGIALGRLLFYDTRLSGNNKLSCSSCHKQELAFGDGVAQSNIGVSGKKLIRHSPSLINLAWAKNGLFWDGGATNLESQAFGPLTNLDEMGQDLIVLENELKQVPSYVKAFKNVFDSEIKSIHIAKALAQFQRALISGNSKYDQYKRNEANAVLNSEELLGMKLVESKCKNCHAGELFTDFNYHNNGIDSDFSNKNFEGLFLGRFRVSFNPLDLGKFKTPTLRNVMLTAPF